MIKYEQVKNGRLETMRPKSEQYLISLGRRGALVSPKVFQKRETKNITPSDISVMYKSNNVAPRCTARHGNTIYRSRKDIIVDNKRRMKCSNESGGDDDVTLQFLLLPSTNTNGAEDEYNGWDTEGKSHS